MPRASVVIPAYNQGRFLAEAVGSALHQTLPDVEVIVVDDGSTDETPSICADLATRPRVTIIRQANAGLPAARNRGLAASRGEFVCFLDSDDVLLPTHLAQLVAACGSDAQVGFAYGDVQMVDESGQPSSSFSVGASRRTTSGDILESLLIGGYFPPHAVVVRRAVLDQVGAFDDALGGHADYELWLRIAAAGYQAVYVDERLAKYRVYASSMSRDREHMRATRHAALESVARRYPARMAAALSGLQEFSADLFEANKWLHERWATIMAEQASKQNRPRWSILDRLGDAELLTGAAEQLALWETTIGETTDIALFLHPPAVLRARVPDGRAGRLSTAVAIHPNAWGQPNACACTFAISVDDCVAGTVLLDPHRRAADRRWVSLTLDVPESASGAHVVTLESQSIDEPNYGWAVFRTVTFTATA